MSFTSPCPSTGYTVNDNYTYTAEILGSFSGGTLPTGTTVPHPEFASSSLSGTGGNCVAIQMNSVTLGGFAGLNN